MKIRIEGNSVRYRLRMSEVTALAKDGTLEGSTEFPGATFRYCLKSISDIVDLQASLSGSVITVEIPKSWVMQWPDNQQVGFETQMPVDGGTLHILIEKDFVCLDRDLAHQTDQYPNPKLGKLQ